MLSLCACACGSSDDQSNYSYDPATGGTTNLAVGGDGTQGGAAAIGGNAQTGGGSANGTTARNTGGARPQTTGGRAAVGGGVSPTGGRVTGSTGTGGGATSGTVTCTCTCTCLTASCSGPTTRTCQVGDAACNTCQLPCAGLCGGPSSACAGVFSSSGMCVTTP